jgi:uncharacterized phage-associated protein
MTKIQSVGLHILSKYGKEAGTIELNKLFYLADVASYRLFGKTVSGTKYIRAEMGPYSRAISQELCLLEGKQIKRETKPSKGFSSFPKVAWSVTQETKIEPELAPEENEIINQVLDKVRGLAPRDLEKLSYQTEPMTDILTKEVKNNCPLLQEPLDFTKIKRDEFMQEFLTDQKTPLSEEEKEHIKYYDREWQEVELMLQGN